MSARAFIKTSTTRLASSLPVWRQSRSKLRLLLLRWKRMRMGLPTTLIRQQVQLAQQVIFIDRLVIAQSGDAGSFCDHLVKRDFLFENFSKLLFGGGVRAPLHQVGGRSCRQTPGQLSSTAIGNRIVTGNKVVTVFR